jgi:type IV secretory pathway VirD2 relaxase
VRGADDRRDTLVIHRDYISHGMRERAVELVTIELGAAERV